MEVRAIFKMMPIYVNSCAAAAAHVLCGKSAISQAMPASSFETACQLFNIRQLQSLALCFVLKKSKVPEPITKPPQIIYFK